MFRVQLSRLLKLGFRLCNQFSRAFPKVRLTEQHVNGRRAGLKSGSARQFLNRPVDTVFAKQFRGTVDEPCIFGDWTRLRKINQQRNSNAHIPKF